MAVSKCSGGRVSQELGYHAVSKPAASTDDDPAWPADPPAASTAEFPGDDASTAEPAVSTAERRQSFDVAHAAQSCTFAATCSLSLRSGDGGPAIVERLSELGAGCDQQRQ